MSESMTQIEEKLQQHLQVLYRQVVDADSYLDDLRQQGKAKFQDVFADNQVFTTSSNRFQPYLQEVTENVEQWQLQQDNEALLQVIVQQLQLLTETLARLKQIRQAG
ncbi:MAG: primosomal replication protein PriC [Pseudomonadota bacterium]